MQQRAESTGVRVHASLLARWPRNDHTQMCAPLCQVASWNVVIIMIA